LNSFPVRGKLAVITGATRGIGLWIAGALGDAGVAVILVGRDEAGLQSAAEGLRKVGIVSHASRFDLLQTSEIATWFEDVCAKFGTPDILVNATGISHRRPAVDLPISDWHDVSAINATAIFELSRTFAKRCISEGQGGRVINIASLLTAAARAGIAPYVASKGAVGQLTKALAVEWAKSGILVNAIAPGYIDTELTKPLRADPAFDNWVKQRCPLGRWGVPKDIAGPAVFLASSAADFITGQIIFADGGWLATF
jgi:gluconate 5-dehydrogenase